MGLWKCTSSRLKVSIAFAGGCWGWTAAPLASSSSRSGWIPRLLTTATTSSGGACSMTSSSKAPAAATVLSIQSHVVHGYCGNKAATFPLQLLGLEVEPLNTVQFSRSGVPMGQTTSAEEFAQIVEGLRSKSLLKSDYVLSGYMRSPDLLRATGSLVEELQRANPSLSYFLDPVMGDNGRMYVPEELTNVYKTVLLPLATVITPNAFEAERLSGIPITCEESAAAACRMLHSLGPQTVVITSLNGPNLIKKDETEGRVLLASTMLAGEQRMYRVTTPSEKGNYGGCGDLFAACLLGHMHRSRGDFASSLELACSSTHAVISRTAQERPGGEMCVIQSQEEICRPMKRFQAEAVVCEDLAIAGIIYDMDGTLTLPGHIDFDRMRTRIGLGPGTDILEEIRKLPADQQEAAVAIVEEEEMAALERLELQPGLHEVTELIRGWRVRCAIATKNMGAAVDFFMDRTGLSHEIFAPLITRDFPFTKPDPRVATAICEQWGIPAHQTLFVGDHEDDMRSGKGAGCITVLVCNEENRSYENSEYVDLRITSLMELPDIVRKGLRSGKPSSSTTPPPPPTM